jgi:HD-like signal output (HDOD) protein/HPt (histidine-containing phosphotransfer) domain-containing protein
MYEVEELEDFLSTMNKVVEVINNNINGNLDVANYHTEINNIFREIHTLKAKAYYFEFDEISLVCDKAEDIFTFILKFKCVLVDDFFFWFGALLGQFEIWISEIKLYDDFELSYYNEELDYSPEVKVYNYEKDKVDTHRIILLQKDKHILDILEKVLSPKFDFISTTNSVEDAKMILNKSNESKILITDINFVDGNITDLVKEKLLTGTIIIIISKLSERNIEKIKTIIDTPYVFNYESTNLSDIKKICINESLPNENELIKIPMDSSKMSIEQLASTIKPLSGIIIQVKNACFDDKSSYSEIADIIESDPTLAIKLLRKINSPYYGLKQKISTIKHGVAMIGKKQLAAIMLSELSKEIVEDINVSMYNNVTLDEMIDINRLRSQVMKSWLKAESGIPNACIDDVNTISILSIVGTFLTASAIDFNIQNKKFKSMISVSDIPSVEHKLLGFNSYTVTEKVFRAWGFPKLFHMVAKDILNKKYYNTESNSSKYAFLIHTIHKIFRIDGEIKLTKDILIDIKKNGYNHKNLLHVYKSIVGNKFTTNMKEFKKTNDLKDD